MNKLYKGEEPLTKITLRLPPEQVKWLKERNGAGTVRDIIDKYLYSEKVYKGRQLIRRPHSRPHKIVCLETKLKGIDKIFINDPYKLKVSIAETAAKVEGPITNGLFAYLNYEGIYRGNKRIRSESGTLFISSKCNNPDEKPVLILDKPEDILIKTETFNGKPWQIRIAIYDADGTILYTDTIVKEKNREEMEEEDLV